MRDHIDRIVADAAARHRRAHVDTADVVLTRKDALVHRCSGCDGRVFGDEPCPRCTALDTRARAG